MKFKIDENLPIDCIDLFIRMGYEAETVYKEKLQGCSDVSLIEMCIKEGRILVTLDLYFSDIRNYPPGSNPGVIVLRIAEQSIESVLTTIEKVLLAFTKENPCRKLWIVDERRIRIREQE